MNTQSFTTYYVGLSRVLINEVKIAIAFNPKANPLLTKDILFNKYKAIWDTGATGTVITNKVALDCKLVPTGMVKVYHSRGEDFANTYLVNIILPNNVGFHTIRVTEGIINLGNADVLIGMDIMNSGDFAVTNKDKKTVFTFRNPSVECIDFVHNPYKEIPISVEKKPGRNDPCPCGSGKKYKKCCGR